MKWEAAQEEKVLKEALVEEKVLKGEVEEKVLKGELEEKVLKGGVLTPKVEELALDR